MDQSILGARIKSARERKGISQEELAEALGSSQRAVSEYENGKRRISAVDIPLLAQSLSVPVTYLFYGDSALNDVETAIQAEITNLDSNEDKEIVLQVVQALCKALSSKN